jgi:DNA-binding NarL/FixJ family response regulator
MGESRLLRIMIIDDHPVYRDALSEKVGQCFAAQGVPVTAVAGAQQGLDTLLTSEDRWVVVMDVLMPGLSGLAGIKAFKALPQVAHVVSISGLDEKLWEPRTVSAGATLFLSKNSTSSLICTKLAQLIELPQEKSLQSPIDAYRLTERQRQVLGLIAQGHPNKIIADQLEISEQTVKIHVGQIFKELRVFNRTQAVLKAQKAQLL